MPSGPPPYAPARCPPSRPHLPARHLLLRTGPPVARRRRAQPASRDSLLPAAPRSFSSASGRSPLRLLSTMCTRGSPLDACTCTLGPPAAAPPHQTPSRTSRPGPLRLAGLRPSPPASRSLLCPPAAGARSPRLRCDAARPESQRIASPQMHRVRPPPAPTTTHRAARSTTRSCPLRHVRPPGSSLRRSHHHRRTGHDPVSP